MLHMIASPLLNEEFLCIIEGMRQIKLGCGRKCHTVHVKVSLHADSKSSRIQRIWVTPPGHKWHILSKIKHFKSKLTITFFFYTVSNVQQNIIMVNEYKNYRIFDECAWPLQYMYMSPCAWPLVKNGFKKWQKLRFEM